MTLSLFCRLQGMLLVGALFLSLSSSGCSEDAAGTKQDKDSVNTDDDAEDADDADDSSAVSDDDDEPKAPKPDAGRAAPKPDAGSKDGAAAEREPLDDAGKQGAMDRDDAGKPDVGKGDASVTPVDPPEGDAPTSASTSKAGAFSPKTYTSGYRDAPGYADSTIHYPDGQDGPLAAVAIVPGFVSPQSSIITWGPFLASHGIIAITIGTNSPSDQPNVRATALMDAIETLKSENDRDGSPIKGKVATDKLGVMGWSMGGGGALIAAQDNPELKATISLCGWASGGNFAKMEVPSLLFAGTADNTASAASHTNRFYMQIPEDTKKLIYNVQGGAHSVANNPSSQQGAIGRIGLSWLKLFLEGDTRYEQFLKEKPASAADFRSTL